MVSHHDRFGPWQTRFDARVIRSDKCWIWVGVTSNGYGIMRVNGHRRLAHRLSYERFNGPVHPNLCVLHKCDTPTCVNPQHLFLGSRTDNSVDKIRKGRVPRGEVLPHARLTTAAVHAIREANAKGISQRALALEFKIDPSAISRVVARKRWSHV